MTPVRFQVGDLLFVWDADKAAGNVRKHGVTFEEAATTWFDHGAIERYDEEHSDAEDRWLRIGETLTGVLLVVWSTERKAGRQEVIRIIGARRAGRGERRLYEDQGTSG